VASPSDDEENGDAVCAADCSADCSADRSAGPAVDAASAPAAAARTASALAASAPAAPEPDRSIVALQTANPADSEDSDGKITAQTSTAWSSPDDDCGTCIYCLDKPKFGGPNKKRQACVLRGKNSSAASSSHKRQALPPRNHASKPAHGRPELPPLRNSDATRITLFGFSEAHALLSGPLCDRLGSMHLEDMNPGGDPVEISNAVQQDLTEKSLCRDVHSDLTVSSQLHAAVESTFGARGFTVHNLKVLETPNGTAPQIPHADDYWNRELFVVVHLRPGQQPTQCVPYDATAAYSTDIHAQCSQCQEFTAAVTDYEARRREHLQRDKQFTCAACVANPLQGVGATRAQSRDEIDLAMQRQHYDAFAEVLLRPAETIARMRSCGHPEPSAGDAIIGLPTLVHRGPGNSLSVAKRRVLFFTVRPKLSDAGSSSVGKYESDIQIHAAWLLWRCEDVCKDVRQHILAEYKKLGYSLEKFEA